MPNCDCDLRESVLSELKSEVATWRACKVLADLFADTPHDLHGESDPKEFYFVQCAAGKSLQVDAIAPTTSAKLSISAPAGNITMSALGIVNGSGGTLSDWVGITGKSGSVFTISTLSTAQMFLQTASNSNISTVPAGSGAFVVSNTTDESSSTTGTLQCTGGAGIAKTLYLGTGLSLPTDGGTASTLDMYEEGLHSTAWQGP